MVMWYGYDMTYNTWEDDVNVHAGLIKAYRGATDGIAHPKYQLSDKVGGVLLKQKLSEGDVEVEVPLGAGRGKKLLTYFSTPPSRDGKTPLKIVADGNELSVQMDRFEDGAWALNLGEVRPDHAFGCVVFNKGRVGNTNMCCAGPPFIFSCAAPPLPAPPPLSGTPQSPPISYVSCLGWGIEAPPGMDVSVPT